MINQSIDQKTSLLFETTAINGMQIGNRFVRSATWEGLATAEGAVTPKLIQIMVDLALGKVGLIVSGNAYVQPEGQVSPWQMGIDRDGCIDGLRKMTRAVHATGGKIVVQLAHAGINADAALTGRPVLAVSDIDGVTAAKRRMATADDIRRLVRDFAAAAARAKAAGFDGVQLHSAHGHLLSQFLSPFFNRRSDSYGGSIRNRVRVHLEIIAAVRDIVGPDYPILVKLNGRDFCDNGLDLEEALEAAVLMAAEGLDAVEVSGGVFTNPKTASTRVGIRAESQEAYFRTEAQVFTHRLNIPVALVGGMRSWGVAERIVRDGIADYISLSRPLIREPDLVRRWQAGDRRRSPCVSDNLCFTPGVNGDGVYCRTRERETTS